MRRLMVLVIGLLTAWFGIASPSAAMVGPTMPQVTCTYDSNPIAAQLDDPATERGPPVTYDYGSALDAADCWSRGASARQRGGTPRGTTTHPTPVSPAWDARRTATTQELARGVDGDRSSAAPVHVAAETVPEVAQVGDTVLYQKLSSTGEHLKYGITKNPATRYTSKEMNGGSLNILARGAKQDMLALERALHEWLPIGPEEGQLFYIQKQIANGLRPPPYPW